MARYGNYYDSRASKGEGHEAYETSSCHAARLHALYRAAADGMPTLADPGYEDVGIGIQIPMQQPPDGRELDLDNRTRNTLQHTTASPSKIPNSPRGPVLTHFEYGYIK